MVAALKVVAEHFGTGKSGRRASDRQIEDLDETVGLRPESEVVFVHLIPLKGG